MDPLTNLRLRLGEKVVEEARRMKTHCRLDWMRSSEGSNHTLFRGDHRRTRVRVTMVPPRG